MSGIDALQSRAEAAHAIVMEAGTVARNYFRSKSFDVREKGANDLVTTADLAVDSVIRTRLSERFPDDGVFSEESGGDNQDRLWIVDPIDGSGNFARGITRFGISIAFRQAGDVELGLVYNVMADEMFVARRHGGATCNDRPIFVGNATCAGVGLIEAGYSHRHAMDRYLEALRAMDSEGYAFCQQGSAALGLADVACGRLDGYWELDVFAWDALAGLLLVQEAGGWTSPFDANVDLLRGRPVLACSGALAAPLRRLSGIDSLGR